MSETKSNFVKVVLAKLQGDEDQLVALKNEKLATSAIATQIALKEGELVDLESQVEDANEALNEVMFPSTPIDRSRYVQNILAAQEKVTDAEENLAETKATLKFLKSTLGSFK